MIKFPLLLTSLCHCIVLVIHVGNNILGGKMALLNIQYTLSAPVQSVSTYIFRYNMLVADI